MMAGGEIGKNRTNVLCYEAFTGLCGRTWMALLSSADIGNRK